MEYPQISQDDITDVFELTGKLETYISKTLKDNELNVSMSALMGSCINCLLGQCKTVEEAVFYRNVLMEILDSSIRDIKIKGL